MSETKKFVPGSGEGGGPTPELVVCSRDPETGLWLPTDCPQGVELRALTLTEEELALIERLHVWGYLHTCTCELKPGIESLVDTATQLQAKTRRVKVRIPRPKEEEVN